MGGGEIGLRVEGKEGCYQGQEIRIVKKEEETARTGGPQSDLSVAEGIFSPRKWEVPRYLSSHVCMRDARQAPIQISRPLATKS